VIEKRIGQGTGQILSEISALLLTAASGPQGVTYPEAQILLAGKMPDTSNASARLYKMEQRGFLFAARHPGQHVRWFTTAEAARAWLRAKRGEFEAQAAAKAEAARKKLYAAQERRNQIAAAKAQAKADERAKAAAQPRLIAIGEKVHTGVKQGNGPSILLDGSTPVVKRKATIDPPVRLGKVKHVGGVIIPRHVKVQICPSPGFDVRYQLPPNERVVGGFATIGVGRYLE